MSYQENIPALRPGKAHRKAMVSAHPDSQRQRLDLNIGEPLRRTSVIVESPI